MLTIIVPEREYYDEEKNEFHLVKEQKLVLEHSLISISKWESKYFKPFISNEQKTYSEILDYIQCMTITQNVDPLVYKNLTPDNIKDITEYIDSPMSATVFFEETKDKKQTAARKRITSELIYYWMAKFNIPFDICEKWHFNRLQNLLRICAVESSDSKMSREETIMSNRELNALRRAKYNTRG